MRTWRTAERAGRRERVLVLKIFSYLDTIETTRKFELGSNY